MEGSLLPAYRTTNTDNRLAIYPADTPQIRSEVLAAVPVGSAIASSQGAFLRALDEHPDVV